MLVYDITKWQRFNHVERWVEELRAHANNSIVLLHVKSVTHSSSFEFSKFYRFWVKPIISCFKSCLIYV
ncbi:hypothetical protein CRYUN_Cryun16bG0064100 [Craigia yunnanensis]